MCGRFDWATYAGVSHTQNSSAVYFAGAAGSTVLDLRLGVKGVNVTATVHPVASSAQVLRGLGERSLRGAAWTFFSQTTKFVVQIGSSAVLARILTPEDFGLIGMVSAVTGVLTIFGSFGLSAAIVQQRQISHKQLSTLFWINVILSVALGVITVSIAPLISLLYQDNRLIPVTVALGSGFLIGGLGVQHLALLKRQMNFNKLAMIEIVSSIVAAVFAISLALLHLTYWSLVGLHLATILSTCLAAWIVCPWRPGRPFRNTGIRSMLEFGGNLTLFNLVYYLARTLDNVLIGWRWGPASLGQYSKAYNLLIFPVLQINTPLSNVAIPVLSRLQDDPMMYRAYFLRAVNLVAYVSFPVIVGLGVFSVEIIAIVLGPQWSEAATIFRVLSVSAILQPVFNTGGWLFTSLNRTNVMAKWGLLSSLCYILSFMIGLRWGALGVAASYSVASWLVAYPCFSAAVSGTPVTVKDIAVAVQRPFAVTLILGATMIGCRLLLLEFGLGYMLSGVAAVCASEIWWMHRKWPEFRQDLSALIAAWGPARKL